MASAPTSTTLLWPDEQTGPWLVTLWWRAQYGVPTPVGISLTSWVDQEDERGSGPHNALPRASDDVALPRIGRQLLRSVPVGQLIEASRAQLDQSLSGARDHLEGLRAQGLPAHASVAQARLEGWKEQTEPMRTALRSGLRGRDLGDDHYRRVAEIYSAAVTAGEWPTAAVQKELEVSKSSAAQMVRRARVRGLLPWGTNGRVGPVTEEL